MCALTIVVACRSELRQQVVNQENLSAITAQLGLAQVTAASSPSTPLSERQRSRLTQDTFHAVVAAIYLDNGASAAKEFVQQSISTSAVNTWNENQISESLKLSNARVVLDTLLKNTKKPTSSIKYGGS